MILKVPQAEETFVVMPVYNEAEVVTGVIKDVKRYFSNIVCVNDGSQDNSGQMILDSGAILVEHSINLGAGAATQTGVEYALMNKNIKYFVTIDADAQHNIGDAINMLKMLQNNNLDIVFGSRFIGVIKNINPFKRIFLKMAGFFSKTTTGISLSDPHIGLRAFNRKFAENVKITLPGFAHASELIHKVADGNYKFGESPVTVTYSDYSKAKGQPMLNAINIAFDILIHRITK